MYYQFELGRYYELFDCIVYSSLTIYEGKSDSTRTVWVTHVDGPLPLISGNTATIQSWMTKWAIVEHVISDTYPNFYVQKVDGDNKYVFVTASNHLLLTVIIDDIVRLCAAYIEKHGRFTIDRGRQRYLQSELLKQAAGKNFDMVKGILQNA